MFKVSKNLILNILIILGIFVAIAVVMNWQYVVKQTRHVLNLPSGTGPVVIQRLNQTEPNTLRIPRLEITAPVQYIEGKTEKIFQEALAKGVVHYPETAKPGEVGNVYIFGHSSDLAWAKGDYKTVFALLPDIKTDERIFISDTEGKEYEYRVTGNKIVAPTDLSVLSQGTGGKKILSLQTSYPIGTALKRFVVIAELVE